MLSLLVPSALAATLTVDPADGTAYPTITDAIAAASSGDVIEIAAGTYTECLDTAGLDLAFVGVAGSTSTILDGGTPCRATPIFTIDDGEIVSVTGLTVNNPTHKSFSVSASTLELDDVVVDGNTLHTGSGTGLAVSATDAVVSIHDSTFQNISGQVGPAVTAFDSDLTITDSTMASNTADRYAGAMYYFSSGTHTLSIDGSTFQDNAAVGDFAGAINIWGDDRTDADPTTVVITDTVFQGNEILNAVDDGAALVVAAVDDLEISGCTFRENVAGGYVGALELSSVNQARITGNDFLLNEGTNGPAGAGASRNDWDDIWSRNVFMENSAASYGGALTFSHSSVATLENNTFVGNTCTDPTDEGSEIWIWSATVTAVNNIFAYGTGASSIHIDDTTAASAASFTYNDFYGHSTAVASGYASITTGTGGNLADDPLFVDYTQDGDPTNDDLSLASGSTLIDAGDPSTTDPDGSVADIGAFGGGTAAVVDDDGDGFDTSEDCDDTDPAVYPGATEACDGVDDDCDGDIDEAGATGEVSWYADTDGDGFGDPDAALEACDAPEGYTADATDCDDGAETVFPGAAETWYDGVDSDCAGDDDFDQDADGTAQDEDCDDTDPTVHPGAEDTWYDGVDSDCAGDDDFDQDADGSVQDEDCDDTDPTVHPGAEDTPDDGIDSDCDGEDPTSDGGGASPLPEEDPGKGGCSATGSQLPTGAWLLLATMLGLVGRARRGR